MSQIFFILMFHCIVHTYMLCSISFKERWRHGEVGGHRRGSPLLLRRKSRGWRRAEEAGRGAVMSDRVRGQAGDRPVCISSCHK
jgi:hypothetical protein